MAEEVKFIEFTEVPNAPKLAVPADFTQSQIDDYLKSEKVENAMFEKGFRFKYGLQPVDMLEMENLDDGSFTSSWKAGWDSVYAIGQGALANFYDFLGAEERQQEALKTAEQYLLDRSAHIFQVDEEGKLLPRPNTIEDILKDEHQLSAFMKYLKHTSGNAAATSIPIMLTALVGAGIGSVVPGVGTAIGGYTGAALGAYVFGMGDTTLAQREAGAVDPNAALSMALAVPYAAVELLGVGGVFPKAFMKVFGGRKAAQKILQKEVMHEITNKPKSKLIKSIPGLYAKGTLQVMMGEGFAEAVQETLNRTAEGNVIGFNKLYSDPTFVKQLGEAAAAGFFGGFGFGLINPTIDTVKMIGSGTGPTLKGAAGVADLNKKPDNPVFKDAAFRIGDTVTVDNIMLPDIKNMETPLFGKKPKFKVEGTVQFTGEEPQFVLSSPDIPTGVAFIPIKNIGLINLEVPIPTPSANDEGLNYNYDTPTEKESTPDNPLNLKKEYSNTKKAFVQTGHIKNASDETVNDFLGGREQIINEVVNEIQNSRNDFNQIIKDVSAEDRTAYEKDGLNLKQIPSPLEAMYKKYDGLDGEALREAVTKDFTFWRDTKLINNPPESMDTNALNEKEREELKKLGYQEGPLGTAYIDKLVNDLELTKNKKSTVGRQKLNNIIKTGTPFSSVSMYQGGPYTEKVVVGEKEIIKEPLTDEEKASMAGEGFVFYEDNGKLVPMMSPLADSTRLESLRDDQLYQIPLIARIRMILELADKLDYRGLRTRYTPYYNDVRKALRLKINAAVSQYGSLSAIAKKARKDLKDFNNTGDHIIVQPRRPGDPNNVFRLYQILSPAAIRAAENLIGKNQRDSSWRSTDPAIKGPLESENVAYEYLIAAAYQARDQLNALLGSMSVEPITNWETLTYTNIKKIVNKVRKLYNQTETQVTRRKIKESVTYLSKEKNESSLWSFYKEPTIRLSVDENAPLIIESMRIMLDKMGLSSIDVAITDKILANMTGEEGVRGITPGLFPLFKDAPYGLIMIAFHLDSYNQLNKYIELKNSPAPKLKAQAMTMKNNMLVGAVNTLHHETIHWLKKLGAFTDKEWAMLEREADKWIKEFKNRPTDKNRIDIEKLYPGNKYSSAKKLEVQREEAIAYRFGEYAVGRRGVNNIAIQNLFIRIKSFLLALVNALKGAGFMTPESIFNNIEAGLVGQRIQTQNDTMKIYNSKDIDQMMLTNPRGDVVLSHVYMDSSVTRSNQQRYLEGQLGQRLIKKPLMEALREKGYTDGVPEVESLIIEQDAQGNIRQVNSEGGVIGSPVPPLHTEQGMLFELKRSKFEADGHIKVLELFLAEGQLSTLNKVGISEVNEKNIIIKNPFVPVKSKQIEKVNKRIATAIYSVVQKAYQDEQTKIRRRNHAASTESQWEHPEGYWESPPRFPFSLPGQPIPAWIKESEWYRAVEQELKRVSEEQGVAIPSNWPAIAQFVSNTFHNWYKANEKYHVVDTNIMEWSFEKEDIKEARVPMGQDRKYEIRFTTTPSKIKWAAQYKDTNIPPIGIASGITNEKQSLFVHMTPDQYLNLTLPLTDITYDRKTLKFMAQAVVDGKEFGVPYLIVQLNEHGTIAKIIGQEGRHRITTAQNINGPYSTIPVAIQFISKDGVLLTKDTNKKDPVNKELLNKWLDRGFLEGMDRNIFRKVGAPADLKKIPPTIRANKVIDRLYQSFEQSPQGYNFSNLYIDYNGPNAAMEVGSYNQAEVDMNRFDIRNALRQFKKEIKKENEMWREPGGTATLDNMSAERKILGHPTAVANMNTPFKFLFHNIKNITEKARSLQQALSVKFHKRFGRLWGDPVMRELLKKAIIIAQMTRPETLTFDPTQQKLIFVAPKDSVDSDSTVKAGEVVVLEGDMVGAFMDNWEIMRDLADESLRAEIAADYVPTLLQAIAVLKENMPEIPELKTLFSFYDKNPQEINDLLESLNYVQLKFIKEKLSQIMAQIAMKQLYTEADPSFIGPPGGLEMGVMMEINDILGDDGVGLNSLVNFAGQVEMHKAWPYTPLMRYGNFYITVHDMDDPKKQLWYEKFETRGEAQAAREALLTKFPEAIVSDISEDTIDTIRSDIERATKPLTLEYLAQFIDNSNAQKYAEVVKKVRKQLKDKGLDKQVLGINQFFEERDRSVGMEGVPGYSADFARSTMQYIMVASNALARNRFITEAQKNYTKSIAWGKARNDKHYTEFVEKYWKYVEDPVQEFAGLRRMGFWWYLGGNLSSALLQGMSMVMFTGPLLAQLVNPNLIVSVPLRGTAIVGKELSKNFAWVNKMVVHGVFGERQFPDAFFDFTHLPPEKENVEMNNALRTAIGDGTIKQGQAFEEAGMAPSITDPMIGPKGRTQNILRFAENTIIGGTFNTFEVASRMVAFMTIFNLAKNDPKVLDNADILYGNDQNYQMQMKQFGRGPEALARFMTSDTFGVYGKMNRQWLGRGFGSLPALFMTYMTQMMGLMYRMLNPPIIKRTPGKGIGFRIAVMDPSKTKAQNAMGRKAFARIMLMMILTGGVFGLPGGEDAEDTYDLVKKMITGVESDVRTEFRNMLYEAGWGPTMIESVEKGLISAWFNIDVQRRVGFGMVPWSQQVRALLNITGIPTGAKAEQFMGAPGSVFSDMARGLLEQGVREGNWWKAFEMSSPTFVRNMMKAVEYSPLGNGYAATGYGTVLTHDISALDIFWQSVGFTPTSIAKEREAIFQERKLDKATNLKRQRINTRITNAYRDIFMGGLNNNGELMNEGQQKIADVLADLMEYNAKQPSHLQFFPDLQRLRDEALAAVYPDYRIIRRNKKSIAEKRKLRLALGLD